MPNRLPPRRLSPVGGAGHDASRFELRRSVSALLRLLNWPACLGILLAASAANSLHAQTGLPGVFLSRSVSGQFVIQSSPFLGASPLTSYLENDTNFVRLDPVLLTVSCERIKQLVWRQLGITSPWSRKIYLKLFPTSSADDLITIEAEQFRDGWQYRVSLPTISQRERFVRAIVNVVLLELANKESTQHSAELPTWLSEGFAREIWATDQREVILPPPRPSGEGLRMTTLLVNARQQNALQQAHQELCAATPLTFEQLSWPVAGQLNGEAGELYRSSAQVFVHRLLGLPNGPACLRAMLAELPRYYNWQFAFFHAFDQYFQRPVDVEKWWSLELVHFTGRELGDSFPEKQGWQKLDELVRSAVELRIGTNELPLHAEVALQTVIRDWPPERQVRALENKLRELQMLRPRLANDLAALTDDYCRIIETHLATLNRHGFVLPFRKHAQLRRSTQEVLQRLDDLDQRRAKLRPAAAAAQPLEARSDPVSAP